MTLLTSVHEILSEYAIHLALSSYSYLKSGISNQNRNNFIIPGTVNATYLEHVEL